MKLPQTLSLLACLALPGLIQSNRIPTLQRLSPANLTTAEMDAAEISKNRGTVGTKTGHIDYRCILHAHSYLSHDSRGTIAEITAAAKSAGVDAIFMTNHPKKDQDVVTAGQHGEVDGVLYFSGAETNGFLAFPGDDKLSRLDVSEQAFVDSINKSGGLVFIAHPEEHTDWSLKGLTGTEIYNTHADLKDEKELMAALQPRDTEGYGRLLGILNAMSAHPQAAFAALFDPPTENLKRYDAVCKTGIYAAIAGNDSHQNTGFILRGAEGGRIDVEDPLGEKHGTIDAEKNPIVKTLFGQPIPGKELMRRVLDPYPVSFHYVSTHVLAKAKTHDALKQALREGRTYVAFDWICDPTGTAFTIQSGGKTYTIGDTMPLAKDMSASFEVPVSAQLRVLRDGEEVQAGKGRGKYFPITAPGIYRAEAYLTIGGEQRAWIYTGAIRITEPR